MELNKYYDLSVYADAILGSTYRTVRLVGIFNYETARAFESIDALHRQVYGYLPEGTPRDHTKYTYYQFDDNGRKFILAEHWIVEGSIEETSGVDFTINLRNVSNKEIETVRDSLRLLGLDFEIL